MGPALNEEAGGAAAHEDDTAWMRRALALAERGVGRTSPNPAVGAVVLREGRVVGEGFHHRAGEPHAEALALAAAGDAARGATLFVTLEPCCHWGRTPPCTEAVVAAGIRRVVAAMPDPDPRVSGRGLRRLREAGLEVRAGVGEAEARELNLPFVTAKELGRPFFLLKYAMTLDGRIATASGDARWVSGQLARQRAHAWRDRLDAVLVGVGTVLADDPLLTCRIPGGRDPARVVADSAARTPPAAQVVQAAARSAAPTIVAVCEDAPAERIGALRQAGADVWQLPRGSDGRVDLVALALTLLRHDLMGVLLEGGAGLSAAALEAGLVDRVACFLAPKLIGGRTAPGPVGGDGTARMADALPLADVRLEAVGEDWLLTARRAWRVHWPR